LWLKVRKLTFPSLMIPLTWYSFLNNDRIIHPTIWNMRRKRLVSHTVDKLYRHDLGTSGIFAYFFEKILFGSWSIRRSELGWIDLVVKSSSTTSIGKMATLRSFINFASAQALMLRIVSFRNESFSKESKANFLKLFQNHACKLVTSLGTSFFSYSYWWMISDHCSDEYQLVEY